MGWYRPNTSDIPFIDFHLAGRGTLNFKNEKKHIRYNFCSEILFQKYLKKKEKKKMGYFNDSEPKQSKNTHEFLLVIRKIYDKNIYPKVLLICSNWNKGLDKKKYYIELMDDYDRLFSFEERRYLQ